MVHTIVFATNTNEDTLQQFQSRLLSAGVQTKHLQSDSRLNYFESTWDDADSPAKKNPGPQSKELKYNGEAVTCGTIYQLRNKKNLSDARIGALFGMSESTITRRRKKHISDGDFYDGSTTVF